MERIIIILLATTGIAYGQKTQDMKQDIKNTVTAIEKAAADRNTEELSKYLHAEYRVVANRFKNTSHATIITREVYLNMMNQSKIGGTSYDMEFNDIRINEHSAMVDITYTSPEAPSMHKYLILIKNDQDNWLVISDVPVMLQ